MNSDILIEVKNVTKVFEGKTVLDDISFSVKKGQIFGLLGPNGAGKTTLIRILSTLLMPTKGTAIVNGDDVIQKPTNVRKSIGLLTETPCIYEKLSVYENIKYFSILYNIPKNIRENKIKELLDLFDLRDKSNDLAGTLSKGMKQKLSLSITLINDPKILFLDEPTSGLDINSKKIIKEMILKFSEEKTIILSSHNIEEIEKLCSVACIIKKGEILKIDKPYNLTKDLLSHTIEMTLKEINKEIVTTLETLGVENYSINENSIIFHNIKDPYEFCPFIINKLTNTGGKIVYVRENTGLEDVYLGLIRD